LILNLGELYVYERYFFLIFLMIAGCSGTLPRGSNIVNEWDRGHNQKIEIFDLLQKPQYADMHNFAALSASIYVDNDSDPMHSRDEMNSVRILILMIRMKICLSIFQMDGNRNLVIYFQNFQKNLT